MIPTLHFITQRSHPLPDCARRRAHSLNCPEENDETMSGQPQPSAEPEAPNPFHISPGGQTHTRHRHGPGTKFLSQEEMYVRPLAPHNEACSCPSCSGDGCGGDGPTGSVPDYLGYPDEGGDYRLGLYHGRHSPVIESLEQPGSLHSIHPGSNPFVPHYLGPRQGHLCCAPGPPEGHRMVHVHPRSPWSGYNALNNGLHPRRHPDADSEQRDYRPPYPESEGQRASQCTVSLSLEQRKVFVTYEEDSSDHLNEILQFVALLRSNGFDTHIDIFEQQYRSISEIDFMEKYINEKDYLIIIVISPQYHDTVMGTRVGVEKNERALNTVYIHKQLQSEYIQNGSKNFRFIPVLFPGAKKCHVPSWLKNTHIFGWPKDRDDIMRRLMRVEKYNPPPIGELPTMVSIPL